MQTGVFGTLGSVELVRPTAAQVAYIHQTYLDLAMSGERSEAHYRDLPRADGDGGRVGRLMHFPDQIRGLPKFDGLFDAFKLQAKGCDVLFASYPAGT